MHKLLEQLGNNIFKEHSLTDDSNFIPAIAKKMDVSPNANPLEILVESAVKLNCDSELCIVSKLGIAHTDAFKLEGPRDVALLSNTNIDDTLKLWGRDDKTFFPYNFNMRNYKEYSFRNGSVIDKPDTLETISFNDLYSRGYTRAGCVVNTDVYQGGGKHWMALYIDATNADEWTVEFFNSSGNSPTVGWVEWMQKTLDEMNSVLEDGRSLTRTKMVKVCSMRQQKSKTECGVYSLFYIYARINGIPYTHFMKFPVCDKIMFLMRQHLFRNAEFENKYLAQLLQLSDFRARFNALLLAPDIKKGLDGTLLANAVNISEDSAAIDALLADNATKFAIKEIVKVRMPKYAGFNFDIYSRIVKILWEKN